MEKFTFNLPKINSATVEKVKKIKPIHLAIFLLLIVSATIGLLYFRSQQDLINFRKDPQNIAKNDANAIIEKVGKIMILPQGEAPTIASVTDPDKLKSQPFFAASLKGDKVLIYSKAKKAILFRPGSNKIVEVAPLNIETTKEGQVAGAQTKLRFVILNGTNVTGLARRYQKEVENKISGGQVISVGDAKSKDAPKTFIVSLSTQDASQIATTLGITAGSLPDGEQKPDADFLVIVGTDKSNL